MTDYAKGHLIFLGALGMMLGLMAPEIGALPNWSAAASPPFVAKMVGHVSVVIVAFVGGKKVPSDS